MPVHNADIAAAFGKTEASVYRAVALPFIEPELREDRGELEATRQGRLPALLQRGDLRGDLHVHTRDSDGHDTIEAMAGAAQAQGLEYIAIADHSRRLAMTHGLDPARLARQIDRIDRINESLRGFTVLKVNAQPARLDLDDTACRMAKAEGVLVSLDSDAHSTLDFDDLHHGIGQARRGWLERADVLNTRTLGALRPLLARTM